MTYWLGDWNKCLTTTPFPLLKNNNHIAHILGFAPDSLRSSPALSQELFSCKLNVPFEIPTSHLAVWAYYYSWDKICLMENGRWERTTKTFCLLPFVNCCEISFPGPGKQLYSHEAVLSLEMYHLKLSPILMNLTSFHLLYS